MVDKAGNKYVDVTKIESKKVSCDRCGKMVFYRELRKMDSFGTILVCSTCYYS